MKKFTLGTVIAAAALFSACSDDSSSSTPSHVDSCDLNATMLSLPVHACVESSDATNAESLCNEKLAAAVSKLGGTTTFGSGCPSGYVKTCQTEYDGSHFNVLIYDQVLGAMDCDQITSLLEQ